MTPHEIVRVVMPKASDGLCEHILWSRTPYAVGRVSARDLYKATSQLKRAAAQGRQLCDFCDRLAVSPSWVCEKCQAMLKGDSGR